MTDHARIAGMHLDVAIETIENVDQRAMACDGPVTPTRLEMRDEEMCDIYESLLLAKNELAALAVPPTEEPRLPDHLQDDAPYAICDTCGRKTWSGEHTCGMPQPDGSRCTGTFGRVSPSQEAGKP